ncbi:MAG TPA: Gfo/Idh/MocA family oxidoreductase [Stellaceae bacterium]|nr:Gfo/Idh/MocA family oxidoreductase [Stellaceae bacterium]
MTSAALVVGLGSIGRRHARLLGELGLEVAAVSRRADAAPRCYASLGEALARETPGYVVVANETSAHRASLAALAEAGFSGTVLVEKPLFAEPAPLPENRFAGLYVGYNLRFHPLLAELKRLLAVEPALSAQIYVGQYLPDWRPGRDYRATASATRAAGGGVLRDLSHELDYMRWLFGPCRQVAALSGRSGALDIDSEDVAALLLAFERCPVATLQLNYLDRPGAREIVVNTAHRTLRADLRRGSLHLDGEVRLFPAARDDTYLAQHRSALGNRREALCTAEEGAAAVALIAAAEQAAASGAWVAP